MSDAGHDRRPGVSATRYRGRVIDCDVHHGWATPDDLLPYLPAAWREFVTRPARTPRQGEAARVREPADLA